MDPKILNDLSFLTKLCLTGVLEIYHSLYNKWAPKRQHFSYAGVLARTQLAVMDFNQGSNLKQARTKDGDDRFNVVSSKITKTWTAKPIKEDKDRSYLYNINHETLHDNQFIRSMKNISKLTVKDQRFVEGRRLKYILNKTFRVMRVRFKILLSPRNDYYKYRIHYCFQIN